MNVEMGQYEPRVKHLVAEVNRLNQAVSDKTLLTE